jgi:tRNA wybutosine-synthesizing protein 2
LLAAGIPDSIAPRRWRRIGDLLVIRIDSQARAHAGTIGEIYGSVLGARTVVEDRSGIHGPLRIPDVRVLWGDGTKTIHVEGGVRYALDVARVMLSPGNIEERIGIAGRVRPGAVVADLFAGIGYFTLPVAVRSRPEVVYACELNPTSYGYLVRNIRLNRVSNVVPLLGNCRDIMPRGVADWVLMGHFDAREYLDVAFAALRDRGTIVYHELCPKEQFPDAVTRRLAAAARANWRNVITIRTRIVKSYAPGIVHATAEVEVSPQHRL